MPINAYKSKTHLTIGDTIRYRPAFGRGEPVTGTIASMELSPRPREKYGVSVDRINIEAVRDNLVVFAFEEGRWCYSEQVILDE